MGNDDRGLVGTALANLVGSYSCSVRRSFNHDGNGNPTPGSPYETQTSSRNGVDVVGRAGCDYRDRNKNR